MAAPGSPVAASMTTYWETALPSASFSSGSVRPASAGAHDLVVVGMVLIDDDQMGGVAMRAQPASQAAFCEGKLKNSSL